MTGVTSRLELPYPTSGDPVANGDNAIQALAERINDVFRRYDQAVTVPNATNVGVQALAFGVTFSAVPAVVATCCNSGTSLNDYVVAVDSITTSGCRLVVRKLSGTASGATPVNVSCLVIGDAP